MRKAVILNFAVVFLLLAISTTPVFASIPPQRISITIPTFFDGSYTSGEFSATGPAVESGLFCNTGRSVDIWGTFNHGFQSYQVNNYLGRKLLTCDDGSGTITIQVEARAVVNASEDEGQWVVLEGTGRYQDIQGSGGLWGAYIFDHGNKIGITDHYSGNIH